MKTSLLIRARKNFCVDTAPRHIARHNIRAWIRSLRFLGSNWILCNPIQRKEA